MRSDRKAKINIVRRVLRTALVLALVLTVLCTATGCKYIAGLFDRYFGSGARPTVKFGDMKYERPDIDAAVEKLAEITRSIENNEGTYKSQLQKIMDLDAEYVDVNSMYTLSYIKFAIDTTDEYWAAETEYFDEKLPLMQGALDDLFVACAQSEHADKFEEDYFGEGQLEPYRNGELITDAMVELMQQEAELLTEFTAFDYYSLEFECGGRTDTLMGHAMRGDVTEDALYLAFYEAINKETGRIFIELVKVRNRLAAEAGFDSYADYAFVNLERDYTPAEAEEFIGKIRENIVPLFRQVEATLPDIDGEASYSRISEGRILDIAGTGFKRMDKRFTEALDFMNKSDLFYLGYGDEQYDASFTSYIYKYMAPFIVIKGVGDTTDLLNFVHEFGHFTDAYLNFDEVAILDLNEIASQGLENLFILNAADGDIKKSDLDALRELHRQNTLMVYLLQSVYYWFEARAYVLPENELTVEGLNALARQALAEFGMDNYYPDFEFLWATVPHFYQQAFYVMSYITSNAVALQLYELEQAHTGDGVNKYFELLEWDASMNFKENVERAGLTSPFSGDAVEKLASTLRKMFGI
ncbi:MAG: hypothetical protein II184_09985 [Clostridia bacterium]|nr:hypothetical protein [Clostridia bacterium]